MKPLAEWSAADFAPLTGGALSLVGADGQRVALELLASQERPLELLPGALRTPFTLLLRGRGDALPAGLLAPDVPGLEHAGLLVTRIMPPREFALAGGEYYEIVFA